MLFYAQSGGGAVQDAVKKAANATDGGDKVKEANPQPVSFSEGMELVLEKIYGWWEGLVALLPNILVAAIVVGLFYGLGSILYHLMNKRLRPRLRSDAVVLLFAATARVIIVAIGLFIALEILGLGGTVTSLLMGVGILGIALGFAFQDTLENYIIGVLIAVRKPLEIGDIVETNGHMGYVKDVNLRTTVIEDFLGQRIILPNKEVYKKPLENYTTTGWRKLEWDIGTSYADDPEHVVDVTKKALAKLDFVEDEDSVEMYAMEFGDSAINYILRVNVPYPQTSYFSAKHAVVAAIHSAYQDNDILIPWPIRTLDFNPKGASTNLP